MSVDLTWKGQERWSILLTIIFFACSQKCDLKSEIMCHGKENRIAEEYHWNKPCSTHYINIILNHLPVRKSRRQGPARHWPWDVYMSSLLGNRQRKGTKEEPKITGIQYPYWGWRAIPLGLSKQKVLLASTQCSTNLRRYRPSRSETERQFRMASTQ